MVVRCSFVVKESGKEEVFALKFQNEEEAAKAKQLLEQAAIGLGAVANELDSETWVSPERIASILLSPDFPEILRAVQQLFETFS